MSKFIVVEGSEGVGKSTQIKTIKSFLEEHKIEYIVTREPGGTSFGESIRSIILDQKNDTDNLTDSLLFYASRYENYNKIILPALKNGKTVICDRFHYSTLVYQGIVGDDELVREIHNIFDTIFSKNVIVEYLENKITGEYLDFSLIKNRMIISNNVIYTNLENILRADVIEINIDTKDTKIFMYEENKKVNVKSKNY